MKYSVSENTSLMHIPFGASEEFKQLFDEVIPRKFNVAILKKEGIYPSQLDIVKTSQEFFNNKGAIADISVDDNSNVGDTGIVSYWSVVSDPLHRLYSYYILHKNISKLFNREWAEKFVLANVSGEIYVHDFHKIVLPYCYAFATKKFWEDPKFWAGDFSGPKVAPKHLDAYVKHVVQFVTYASNNIAGAVALPDLLVYMAWLWRKDVDNKHYIKDPEYYLRQEIQSFIHEVNFKTRGGMQSPYTNVSIFSKTFLIGSGKKKQLSVNLSGNPEPEYEGLFTDFKFPDGTDFMDYLDDIMYVQKVFLQVYEEELGKGLFTFPVLTIALAKDEKTETILEQDMTWFKQEVLPYILKYANANIYVGPTSALSSCCRLKNDLSNQYINSFGAASALEIGSHRVVTLNLPRLVLDSLVEKDLNEYEFNENRFWKLLDERLELIGRILHTHKKILEEEIEQGKLPLYKNGLMDLSRQYSTIGIVGLFEMLENANKSIYTEEGREFMKKVLDYIKKKQDEFSERYNHAYNIEQVPAESAAVKLAQKDAIIHKRKEKYHYNLYSNQVIPLTENVMLIDRLRFSGLVDNYLTGGGIVHINIDDVVTEEHALDLINTTVKFGNTYFALNLGFSICRQCGATYTNGKVSLCTKCGGVHFMRATRVVGYYVPVDNWNPTRRDKEYNERVWHEARKDSQPLVK